MSKIIKFKKGITSLTVADLPKDRMLYITGGNDWCKVEILNDK